MVKRQTVWLSTMMVLSLMLIGYYTMSNGSDTATPGGGITSATVTPTPAVSASGTTAAGTKVVQSTTSTSNQNGGIAATTSTSDWFANTEVTLTKEMTQQADTLNQVIGNTNATSEQVASALTELQRLHAMQGNISNAKDDILGEGYQDCVIEPNADKATVYVKAVTMTAEQSVNIMNIVSQQLSIPITNITVYHKN